MVEAILLNVLSGVATAATLSIIVYLLTKFGFRKKKNELDEVINNVKRIADTIDRLSDQEKEMQGTAEIIIPVPEGDAASNVGPDGLPLVGPSGTTPLSELKPTSPVLSASLPFYHPNIKFGDKGPAVQALQTLMHAALGKYTQSAVDGIYGSKTVNDVHRFKYQNPRPGYSSNGNLWELEDWIIAKDIVLSHIQVLKYLDVAAHPPAPPTARDNLLTAAKFGYSNRWNIHYQQIRPMPSSLSLAATQIIYTDCSGFATLVYKMAGLPDPNHFSYNGYGFTGTLTLHGTPVSISSLQAGDLVFYGYPISHVAVADGKGNVYSHGRYPMDFAPVNLGGALPINHSRSYV